MTPENLRFHAAGHLAAGVALVHSGSIEGAKTVFRIVRQFLDAPNIDNPQVFRDILDQAISDPPAHVDDVARLEASFCDPLNTDFERRGIRMGKG